MLSFLKKYMFVILICVLSAFVLSDAYDKTNNLDFIEYNKYTNETIRKKTRLSLHKLYEEYGDFYKEKIPLEKYTELIFCGVCKIYELTFSFVILFSIFLLAIIVYLAMILHRLKKLT